MLDESKLEADLHGLSKAHQVAFAASCCERMIANYMAFCRLEDWGKPDVVRQILDEVWESLLSSPLSAQRIRDLIKMFLIDPNLIPEPGNFRSFLVDVAYLGAGAVSGLLQCCRTNNSRDVVKVALIATETLVSYLKLVGNPSTEEYQAENPELSEWVRQSPLILSEIKKQEEDLSLLRSHPQADAALVDNLRSSSAKTGVQPFRRRLVARLD